MKTKSHDFKFESIWWNFSEQINGAVLQHDICDFCALWQCDANARGRYLASRGEEIAILDLKQIGRISRSKSMTWGKYGAL